MKIRDFENGVEYDSNPGGGNCLGILVFVVLIVLLLLEIMK
jgi:hypothetical protein